LLFLTWTKAYAKYRPNNAQSDSEIVIWEIISRDFWA
jgi:hypothetical protein